MKGVTGTERRSRHDAKNIIAGCQCQLGFVARSMRLWAFISQMMSGESWFANPKNTCMVAGSSARHAAGALATVVTSTTRLAIQSHGGPTSAQVVTRNSALRSSSVDFYRHW